MPHTVTKQGHAAWDDLIGKTFELLWYPGWEDPEWVSITLAGIELTENEFGSPLYYLMDKDGGGYGEYESTVVEVRLDD